MGTSCPCGTISVIEDDKDDNNTSKIEKNPEIKVIEENDEKDIIELGDEIIIGNIKYRVESKLAESKRQSTEIFTIINVSIEDKKIYVLKWIKINEENNLDKCKNEVKILSKFKERSKYIIQYIDCKEEKKHFSIVMEYFGKFNLKQYIKGLNVGELLDEGKIVKIIMQICLGLKDIHNCNIIHRDLTPENIFIDENNNIKIGDFGVSTEVKDLIY